MKNNNHNIKRMHSTITAFIIFFISINVSQTFASPASISRFIYKSVSSSSTSVSSDRVISTMPRTVGQYAKVFGVAPTASQLGTLSKGANELSNNTDRIIYMENKGQLDDNWKYVKDDMGTDKSRRREGLSTKSINDYNYQKQISKNENLLDQKLVKKESTTNFDIVIGHSKRGYLCLSTGDKLNNEKVYKLAKKKDKILILLSCKSDSQPPNGAVGIEKNIEYYNAFKLANDIVGKIEKIELRNEKYNNVDQEYKIQELKKYIQHREQYYLIHHQFGINRITILSGGAIVAVVPLVSVANK